MGAGGGIGVKTGSIGTTMVKKGCDVSCQDSVGSGQCESIHGFKPVQFVRCGVSQYRFAEFPTDSNQLALV